MAWWAEWFVLWPVTAKRFAGQAQIDRPARFAHGDGVAPVDQVAGLLWQFEFIVPFHEFAHNGGLVSHVLAPMNG